MAKKFAVIGRPAALEGYRMIVTGSRYYKNTEQVYSVIEEANERTNGKLIIVQGEAKGADTIAKLCAESMGIKVESHPANWEKYKRAAGPIRNQSMLDESVRLSFFDGYQLRFAVAFHENLAESKGTADMVTRLEAAGIRVLKIR